MKHAVWLLLAATAWAQPACVVEGTVSDKASGEPVAGAHVFLMPGGEAPRVALLERSDRQGAFCFASVNAGDYTLIAQHTGHLDETYGKGLVLAVRQGVAIAPLAVKLTRRAIVSGTVVDGDGEPIAGAQVAVYIRARNGDPTDPDEVESSETDDRGQFRFSSLAPGTYYLGANRRTGRPDNSSAMPFLDATGAAYQEGFQETFYSAAADFAGAKPLEVQAGKDLSGILLTLRKQELRHVSGKVVGAPSGAYVAFRSPNGDSSGMALGSDGSFFRSGLKPGRYTVEVRTGNQIRGKKEVDLTSGDADPVVIAADETPPPPLQINVRFQTEGASQPYRPSPNSFTFLQGTDGNGSVAQLKEDGTFQFQNVNPGQYTLITFAWGTNDYYVKRIQAGGQTLKDHSLDLRNGSLGDILVVMGPRSGIVKGRIATQTALSEAVTILLVGDRGNIDRRVTADQTGAFQIEHVAPGKFHLLAVEGFDLRRWDEDLYKKLEPKSDAIEVAEGETKAVEIPLIKIP